MAQTPPTTRPFVFGQMKTPAIRESSGIVESRQFPGVYWTHNDSGNPPVLYAVRRDGSLINAFPVKCVMLDWEDIAIDDDGHLYLADTGNNGLFRESAGILQITEPDPNIAPDPHAPLVPTRSFALTFERGRRMDIESFFIWKNDGYLISKSSADAPTTLWSLTLTNNAMQTLKPVATLPVRATCTGADLSVDGEQLAVMTIDGPLLFKGLGGDVSKVRDVQPVFIRIPRRTNEAICISKDGLVGTSEERDVYFFPFDAFRVPTTRP